MKVEKHDFVRPRFTPLPSSDIENRESESITSLPDLVEFNAQHNPNHIFCIQTQVSRSDDISLHQGPTYHGTSISFSELRNAIHNCSRWLNAVLVNTPHQGLEQKSPIALYQESDVGLFIHLVALQSLDIPVLLISARLSPSNVEHLLKETKSRTVLASKRTAAVLNGQIDDAFNVKIVEPYTTFLGGPRWNKDIHESLDGPEEHRRSPEISDISSDSERVLILHSSGTTGFPKPIRLTKRYLLGYAACHQFSDQEKVEWVNLSTLPLYHGFGFLAPGLSLSLGMTCCFPPSSIIPAGHSTYELLKTFKCQSLMTVPSIVDDLLAIEDSLEELAKLEFLAVGGGAMKPDQGIRLKAGNVRLLNHYGVTEIGAIAPIFRPREDYNWRYLRLRSDLKLELRPIEGSPRFKLVGYPLGWNSHFEVQDELERNPESPPQHVEIRILGRTDDVIVLKTGEKVMPQHLETALGLDASIKTAVCIGQGSFEPAVIIEPTTYMTDENGLIKEDWQHTLEDHVWELIQATNPSLDAHARISSKQAIIVKPMGKPIPRTDKGSVSRRQVHEIFAQEIEAAYAAMDEDLSNGSGNSQGLDLDHLEASIRDMVKSVFVGIEGQDADQDFFERGMDSLQAVRLARLLNIAIQQHATPHGADSKHVKLSAEFIYRHSCINALAGAVKKHLLVANGHLNMLADDIDRVSEVNNLADKFVREIESRTAPVPNNTTKRCRTVLMTGATGNLGAHMLSSLVRSATVNKIVCLYRSSASAVIAREGEPSTSAMAALTRLKAAVKSAGLEVNADSWQKVELVEDAEFIKTSQYHGNERHGSPQGHGVGDTESTFVRLAHEVTHIAHLAWPMDFHRRAASFAPHLQMVESLVRLCRLSYALRGRQSGPPVRLVFASSIAVVRNYNHNTGEGRKIGIKSVPEAVTEDASVAAPMGYAEAKWICERMLSQLATTCRQEVDPVVVRIGQLSGPETSNGVWKIGEHIPTLVKASRMIGAFPLLHGNMSWLPVDRAARSLEEMMFYPGNIDSFLHLENPVRQPATDIMSVMAYELGIASNGLMPFDEWLSKAAEIGIAESLSGFFRNHFRDLALGPITLDTTKARAVSVTLRGSCGVSRDLIVAYLDRWRAQGLFS